MYIKVYVSPERIAICYYLTV